MALSALELEMSMNLARLQTDAGKAVRIMEGMGNKFRSVLGTLGVGLSVGYLTSVVKGTIDAMDRLNDLSKTTGVAVEQLSGLQFAAKQSGSDLESMAAAIGKLSVNIGKDADKFKALGITAKDPIEAFKQLSEVFRNLEDPQQRAAVMAAALGKAWQGSAPLLAEGGKKIQEMVDKGSRLAGITKEMAEKSDELNDKWLELVGSGGLVNTIIGNMLDPLLRLTNQMIAAKAGADGLISAFGRFFSIGGDQAANPDAAIGAIDSKLKVLRATAGEFGNMGVIKRIFSADDIALVKAQIAVLETQRNMLLQMPESSVAKQNQREMNRAGSSPVSEEDIKKRTAAAAAAFLDTKDKTSSKSPYQSAIEQLEKEAIKVDDLTKRIEILRGIEAGHYGKLDPLQEKKLETLAAIVDKVREETAAKKADADAIKYLQEEAQKLETLADKWRDLADPMRERNRLLAEGNELARIGKLTPEQVRIGTMDAEIRGILQAKTLQEKLDEAWNAGKITLEEYQRVLESMNKETETANNLAHELGMTFSSAFEDAMSGGKSFRDILKGIEKDLLRLGTRKLVTEPMLKWFQSAIPTSSASGGGWLGSLMSMIGIGGSSYGSLAGAAGGAGGTALSMDMFRANGGPVSGGSSYIVGEKGPELFTPAMSGNITPNGSMGMTVNNVFYLNQPADKRTQDQIAARTGQSVQRAIARNT